MAVTAGNGIRAGICRATAARITKLYGIPAVDLSPVLPWGSLPKTEYGWIKTYIWDHVPADVTHLIWVDNDLFPYRRGPLEEIPDVPVAACWDGKPFLTGQRKMVPAFAEIKRMFNSGWMILRRHEMQPIFEKLKGGWVSPHGSGYEQCMLNLHVQRDCGGWHELHPIWNWFDNAPKYYGYLEDPSMEPYNIHVVSYRRDMAWIRALHALTGGYAWQELY